MQQVFVSQKDNPLWSERYRPHSIKQLILPSRIVLQLDSFVKARELPNLLFVGPAGSGKTSAAITLMEEMNCEYLFINGSLERNIDTVRNEITDFATTVSMSGKRKFIIYDEFDNSNQLSTQPSLRAFIEQFSDNCGFVFTANFEAKIIEPIKSRCFIIDFSPTKEELTKLCPQFFKMVVVVLRSKKIEYDSTNIINLISDVNGDWRKAWNELQGSSVNNTFIYKKTDKHDFSDLKNALQAHDFNAIKTWVVNKATGDIVNLYRSFYEFMLEYLDNDKKASFVILTAEYMYRATMVADQQINMTAYLSEVMNVTI